MNDTVYYAIGDIHGEAEKLAHLHDMILADASLSGAAFQIVHLGDLIDRGPDSRGVIARIMSLGAPSVTIMGNHERMLLDAVVGASESDEASWAVNGGDATRASYERVNGLHDDWRDSIDGAHLHWLRTLAITHEDTSRRILFVHAGIDPWRYPNCPDDLKLWTRAQKFFDVNQWPPRPELDGLLVIHGHTPTWDSKPEQTARRINIDTGACFGGPLTCVVLAPNEAPRFLRAS